MDTQVLSTQDGSWRVRVQPKAGIGTFLYFGPFDSLHTATEFASLLHKLLQVIV